MFIFPESIRFEIKDIIDAIFEWVLVTFNDFFDVVADTIRMLFNLVELGLNYFPWWLMVIGVAYAGYKLYNYKMGILLSSMLVTIGLFGLWQEMIYTLAIIIISVFVSVIVGIPFGILMAKSKVVENIIKPILDAMQTMPSFVYLIPAIMLFSFGKVPAVFATTIYAIPPLIRLTFLGISSVDEEVVEAGKSFGSTPLQMLFKIELPQSLSTIMTGVNQTTMMAMAMVVISSMIGAEGIGQIVLDAIDNLEVGQGFQAGFAIVFLAIILDRLLQGFANTFDKGVSQDA